MLPSMPGTAETPQPPKASSFASLLAGFAASTDKTGERSRSQQVSAHWNDDALEEDVATISYEQALRTHTRTRPPFVRDLPDSTESLPSVSDPGLPYDVLSPNTRKPPESVSPAEGGIGAWSSDTEACLPGTAAEPGFAVPIDPRVENRKSASITIRLSKPECSQLHQRAAAAGLSVSAYLRSCIFEAESLRAQVKETLAQLRSATPVGGPKTAPTVPKSVSTAAPSARSLLFPRWNWVHRSLDT
jgi:hypothetical protein